MKQKVIAVILLAALALSLFAGCKKTEKKDLNIICTVFPLYDWVRAILGDRLEDTDLTLLLDSGADLHSYNASMADKGKIINADLFVYIGGESDEQWVPGFLKDKKTGESLNILETLGEAAKDEEAVEGAEEEEEEEEEAKDEHVWLSLRNAKLCCRSICDMLCKIDADHAETYKANLKAYTDKLDALDAQFTETVNSAKNKTIIVADRFPFRYLCDDYSIKAYAAFNGCSTETAASQTVTDTLARKLIETGLTTLIVTEASDKKTANTVIETRNQIAGSKTEIAVEKLNSIQSIAKQDVDDGATYLKLMEYNLTVLKKALN